MQGKIELKRINLESEGIEIEESEESGKSEVTTEEVRENSKSRGSKEPSDP